MQTPSALRPRPAPSSRDCTRRTGHRPPLRPRRRGVGEEKGEQGDREERRRKPDDDAHSKKLNLDLSTSRPLSLRTKNSPSEKQSSPAPAAAEDLRDTDGDLFATARDLDLPLLAEEEEEEKGDDEGGEGEREQQQGGEEKERESRGAARRNNTRAARPSLSDYSHVAVIGRGAFGEVRLVRELKNGNRLAALKSLDKAEMLRRRQVSHVRAERDALATLRALGGERSRRRRRRKRREEGDDGNSSGSEGSGTSESDDDEIDASRHVVALRASFQDAERLHLVMEYLPGGDLMTLLMRMDILPVVGFLFFSFFFFFFFSSSGAKRLAVVSLRAERKRSEEAR